CKYTTNYSSGKISAPRNCFFPHLLREVKSQQAKTTGILLVDLSVGPCFSMFFSVKFCFLEKKP
ncbi:MAG: hypothetical protein II519_07345, partial [Muribaculaceae bacterium]|nr:hypothetical protein [Muribaculaceae bacterium]